MHLGFMFSFMRKNIKSNTDWQGDSNPKNNRMAGANVCLLTAVWILGCFQEQGRGRWLWEQLQKELFQVPERCKQALTHFYKTVSMLWTSTLLLGYHPPAPSWRVSSIVCKGSWDGLLKHAVSNLYVCMCVWHSQPLCCLISSPSVFLPNT